MELPDELKKQARITFRPVFFNPLFRLSIAVVSLNFRPIFKSLF